jgi:hypothetical protein
VLEFLNTLGAGNRVGIGLLYWPARLHSLAELVPGNRFLGSLKVKKFGLWYEYSVYSRRIPHKRAVTNGI